ncbi:rod shape-determining protein MreD [Natroniella sulfidigena]|uniref:rod shape-determining protein MreD n=1 Tax=Natroniella sulfidigena TaxID=723921 RepID=UPI00200B4906|nr:rod shape-determining protein MreD [Natroniella sulfidigena]MCK8815871.1 rod shape-determining protein MreD [Natroniella sulfidigena]
MIYLFYVVLGIVFFICQSLIFSGGVLDQIIPDFLLILVMIISINHGKTAGGVAGFIGGFFQDLFAGGLFGINIITKAIVGFLVGFFKKKVYQDSLLLPPLVLFCATILNQLLVILFTDYLLRFLTLEQAVEGVILPLATLNAGITLIVYPFIYKIDSYLTEINHN